MAKNWTHFPAPAPFSVGTMLLLTDGTVLAQDSGTVHWWRLIPDAGGSYSAGTWKNVADSNIAPLYFASAVLADGTVFLAGGEYKNNEKDPTDLCAAALYDPQKNEWVELPTPPGWAHIGDAPCCVLPNGTVLLGGIDDNQCAIYDPITRTWKPTGGKLNSNSDEESWALLRDGSVLTENCNEHPGTQRYVNGGWINCGRSVDDLVEDESKEIGPAMLLPDGRIFVVGATGSTGFFNLDADVTKPGSWSAGPTLPSIDGQQQGAKDAPCCLMPNGLVLICAAYVDHIKDNYNGPTNFFEFDPATNELAQVPGPPGADATAPYSYRMLLLPNEGVLVTSGGYDIWIYSSDGQPDPSWKPVLANYPKVMKAPGTYKLSGQQFNGLSQACAYGDDVAMATNYPLARLRTQGPAPAVYYLRTNGHSTMAVATGAALVSTTVDLMQNVPQGDYLLEVIANGIASTAVPVKVTY